MSVSPGKIGELIKAHLVRKRYDIPISKTFAVVFAERIIEFMALLLIFILGVFLYSRNFLIIISILSISIAAILLILKNERFKRFIKKALERFVFTKDKIEDIALFKNELSKSFKLKILLFPTIISIVAWILEILSFYVLLVDLQKNISFLYSIFAYSSSILAGAVSMIPGGLFTTEISLLYFLNYIGTAENNAILITLLIRFATLWFLVFIGIISYFIFVKKYKNERIIK